MGAGDNRRGRSCRQKARIPTVRAIYVDSDPLNLPLTCVRLPTKAFIRLLVLIPLGTGG